MSKKLKREGHTHVDEVTRITLGPKDEVNHLFDFKDGGVDIFDSTTLGLSVAPVVRSRLLAS